MPEGQKLSELTAGTPALPDEFYFIDSADTSLRGTVGALTALSGATNLSSDCSASDTEITVTGIPDGMAANLGWVVIDPYTIECEVRKVTGVATLALTVAALDYGHSSGDAVIWIDEVVINVKWFGAVGDDSTDDTVAIQAAWDQLSRTNRDVFIIPTGTYLISDELDWTNTLWVDIRCGREAMIKAKSGVDFSGKAMIRTEGSKYINVHNLQVTSDLTSNPPETAFVIGRTATSDGFYFSFYDCYFYGKFNFSVFYDCCAELIRFYSTNFVTHNANPAYYCSDEDDAGLGLTESSNNHKFFTGGHFGASATIAGNAMVVLNKDCMELTFRDTYVYNYEGGAAFHLKGASTKYNIVWDHVRVEGPNHANSRFLKVEDNPLNYASLRNVIFTPTSDAAIEISDSFIRSIIAPPILADNATYTIQVKSGGKFDYNQATFYNDTQISVESGGRAYNNIIFMPTNASGNYPFTGAGNYESDTLHATNMILATNTAITLPAIRRRSKNIGNDTTPSVEGFSLFRVNMNTPTTVTDFDDPEPGQVINMRFMSAHTTITDGTNIMLHGGANWNPPTDSTLTLYYDSVASKWYELSRSDTT